MIALFILIAGFIIGLGAVTVIDFHGFLGRKSSYWTVATTRTHKVTKPLIWLGTLLVLIGGIIFYFNDINFLLIHLVVLFIMILNGLFLTFGVSRHLLVREKENKDHELLSSDWQVKITISFIISFLAWWSQVIMLVYYLN